MRLREWEVAAHSDARDRLEGPVGAADGVTVCHYLRLPENLPPPSPSRSASSDRRPRPSSILGKHR